MTQAVERTPRYFDAPYPVRPGECYCKVCENGYIRVPVWELGQYMYVECDDAKHVTTQAEYE